MNVLLQLPPLISEFSYLCQQDSHFGCDAFGEIHHHVPIAMTAVRHEFYNVIGDCGISTNLGGGCICGEKGPGGGAIVSQERWFKESGLQDRASLLGLVVAETNMTIQLAHK